MSYAYRCDKCGREIELSRIVRVYRTYRESASLRTDTFDLCEECKTDFEAWLASKKSFIQMAFELERGNEKSE